MRHSAMLLLLTMMVAPAAADIVHLHDGSRLEGEIKRTEEGWEVHGPDGKVRSVAASKVASIELRKSISPDGLELEGRLASLRRSVEPLDDLAIIISRYERFIAQNAGTPIIEQAGSDLTEWKRRRDEGLLKHGDKWVSPTELAGLRRQAASLAEEASRHIAQERTRDAEASLVKALAEDPFNPTALYLRGVLLYQQNQIPAARKVLESLNALSPGHGPTLNNLAVIAWRQNQFPAAMNYYDAAMKVSPLSREILDNLAEASHALDADQKGNHIIARALRRFNEQDARLQTLLAEKELYRWGAGWVGKADLERLKAAEAEVQKQINAMSTRFDTMNDEILKIDRDIHENERAMRQLEAQSYTRTIDGRLIRTPLPRVYYEMKDDNEILRTRRVDVVREMDALRVAARAVQQKLPVPQYSGVQKMMGIEHAPPTEGIDPDNRAGGEGNPETPAASQPAPPATNPAQPGAVPSGSRDQPLDEIERRLLDELLKQP